MPLCALSSLGVESEVAGGTHCEWHPLNYAVYNLHRCTQQPGNESLSLAEEIRFWRWPAKMQGSSSEK